MVNRRAKLEISQVMNGVCDVAERICIITSVTDSLQLPKRTRCAEFCSKHLADKKLAWNIQTNRILREPRAHGIKQSKQSAASSKRKLQRSRYIRNFADLPYVKR